MKLTSFGLGSLAGLLALAVPASAQSINIDIENFFGTPTSTLAAAGQAGVWNSVSATSTVTPLSGLNGALTTATMTRTLGTGGATAYNNLATSGNDQALLDDAQDAGVSTWTIAHLTAGTYNVFVYAWAPDDGTYRTGVAINGPPISSVGGNFAGSYVLNLTHAQRLGVVVPADGSITIALSVVSGYATFNGVQIVDTTPPPPPFSTFCFGDGSGTMCPCSNAGAPGNGCASSVNAAGAHLAGSGVASISNDTLSLNGTGMPASSALYFQGTIQVSAGAGGAFGDGLRCAGGSVIRLGTKTNDAGGSSAYPGGVSLPISVKGADAVGDVRTYQCWYRNAAVFCTASTFNLTNGGQVTWIP